MTTYSIVFTNKATGQRSHHDELQCTLTEAEARALFQARCDFIKRFNLEDSGCELWQGEHEKGKAYRPAKLIGRF